MSFNRIHCHTKLVSVSKVHCHSGLDPESRRIRLIR